jgi:hypothetical protein
MALRTARRLVVRGRPPGRAAGRTGATKAHAVGQVGVVGSSTHRMVPLARISALSRHTATFQTPSKCVGSFPEKASLPLGRMDPVFINVRVSESVERHASGL